MIDKQTERGLNALFAGIVMICGFAIFLIGLADLTKNKWDVGKSTAVALIIIGLTMIGTGAAYINRTKQNE